RACHETELNYHPVSVSKKIAVVGAGPAGLAAATIAAQRGHRITLFEAEAQIGGQFNMAKVIPGKEDYAETIRYFAEMLKIQKVKVLTGVKANTSMLLDDGFDEYIICTGVTARIPDLEGIDHPKVLSYVDVLYHNKPVGKSVAIIGAGGIGFDVATFLSQEGRSFTLNTHDYLKEWGVDFHYSGAGAITEPSPGSSPRKIYLLKRSGGKHGKSLGRTTGWIHRAHLQHKEVEMLSGVQYLKVDDKGLHIKVNGQERILEVDNIVVCAGQEPLRDLYNGLKHSGKPVHLIGGAHEAVELDAKRAIDQAARLVATI
ncbi:MAG TPA: FAD/NAD(P)-binding oxidoreductase, partial [Saprospiraceae bacterium]|nr:FAD/NAD(P)-binding oxidoreductase [Saprospiraceae bacterium]